MDEFNKEDNGQQVVRISDLLEKLQKWEKIGDNRGLYIESLRTLTILEICVFYYWCYANRHGNQDYTNTQISQKCWEKPVTGPMVSGVRRRIRSKFENIFYGIE